MINRLTQPQVTSIMNNVRTIIDSTIETFPEYFDSKGELKAEYCENIYVDDNVRHIKIVHEQLSELLSFLSYSC